MAKMSLLAEKLSSDGVEVGVNFKNKGELKDN
jgi:hypothetical protein